ncbi:MAG: hypothetical protein QNI91_11255 [Arenicellales bacterium]|nr:hypothetical protein [Arenicellales bacterium]
MQTMQCFKINNRNNTYLASVLAMLALPLGLILGIVVPADATAQGPEGAPTLTPMEKAAGGFPLPGDVRLYAQELACQNAIETPGYFSSLNGAEVADSHRSTFYPCASFLGSFDGPNQVFAYKSEDEYVGAYYINNRRLGELYIVGGGTPVDVNSPQAPFVAKADAATGKQIWRTYLENPWVSKVWNANSNLNILENGHIVFMWDTRVVLIHGDTGQILKVSEQIPSGDAPPEAANFKHLTIAPDGTLILKNQNRPVGCTLQGTLAITLCLQKGMVQPSSHLVAMDPKTLEILDDINLPESASSPHIVTTWEGRFAVYWAGDTMLVRAWWDPESQELTLDESFQVVTQLPGQTTGTAPTVMGDWLVVQTNGNGSYETASTLVAVHQGDPTKINRIFPFGELDVANKEWSYAPPKAGSDPENNMVYSADAGLRQVAGIKLDPKTGEMETVFLADSMSTAFQPTLGPKARRVLIASNMVLNDPGQPVLQAVISNNYKEQVHWRDAATGELLAESDLMEPLAIGALVTPGYGGRVYFPTSVGKGFYILQVAPAE